MKSGRLFWGVFFIVAGTLALLLRADVIDLPSRDLVRLWPLILVFWGASLLVRHQVLKTLITILSAAILAGVFSGLLGFVWYDARDDDHEPFVQEFTEPFDPSIQYATLVLDAAAGEFYADETTENMFSASTVSTFARYTLHTDRTDNEARYHLALEGGNRRGYFGRMKNRVELRLSPNPVWDFDFDIGAAKANFDLSPLKTRDITIDAGAAGLRLRLGSRNDETRVRIDAGASSIRIAVPESAGCEVTLDTGLSGKRLPGFEKIDSYTYRTEGFHNSSTKIYVDIEAGVSSIHVNRY